MNTISFSLFDVKPFCIYPIKAPMHLQLRDKVNPIFSDKLQTVFAFNSLYRNAELLNIYVSIVDRAIQENKIPKTKLEDGLHAFRFCLNIATQHSSFEHVHNLQKFQEFLITKKLSSTTQTTIDKFFSRTN